MCNCAGADEEEMVEVQQRPGIPDQPVVQEAMAPAPVTVQKMKSKAPLDLTFQLPDGSTKECHFTNRPIGVEFYKDPLVVKGVAPGGDAEEFGIQEGWQMHSINGRSVSELEPHGVIEMIAKLSSDASDADKKKQPVLELTFSIEDGEVSTACFESRPIGVEFYRKSPVKVKSVSPGSKAALGGLQPGWIIHAINGLEVMDMGLQDVIETLAKISGNLPQALAADVAKAYKDPDLPIREQTIEHVAATGLPEVVHELRQSPAPPVADVDRDVIVELGNQEVQPTSNEATVPAEVDHHVLVELGNQEVQTTSNEGVDHDVIVELGNQEVQTTPNEGVDHAVIVELGNQEVQTTSNEGAVSMEATTAITANSSNADGMVSRV